MMHLEETRSSRDEHARLEEQSRCSTLPYRTALSSTHANDSMPAQATSSFISPAAPVPLCAPRTEPREHLVTLQDSLEDVQFVPPDGGVRAYLKVLGGFCVFFITLGVASTFGSYQAYYETTLLRSQSPSIISWIGTTQVFLLSFVGIFSGAFYDRGYVRLVLTAGMSLIVFGLMMLSFADKYWQILLSQGICVGLGSGLIYVPAVSVVSNQFTSKRTVALGMTATGSAVGGVVLPIMFRQMLPSIGFGWTNRVFGFLVLVLAVVAFVLLTDVHFSSLTSIHTIRLGHRNRRSNPQSEHQPSGSGSNTHSTKLDRINVFFDALHGRSYLFLCGGIFFTFLGYWVPLFFIVPFASMSLGTSSSYASYLLSILNAGSFFGRVVPAYIGQLVGTALVLFVGATSLGVIVFAWLGVGNIPGITVWCFLVGFMSGIVVSIPNAVASRLSNRSNVGFRIGVMWTAGAFAELIGAPIAGALVKQNPYDEHDVSYVGGQVFGGSSILVGAALLIVPAWSIFKDDKVKAARSA